MSQADLTLARTNKLKRELLPERTSGPCPKKLFQLGLGSEENEYVIDGVSQRTPG